MTFPEQVQHELDTLQGHLLQAEAATTVLLQLGSLSDTELRTTAATLCQVLKLASNLVDEQALRFKRE